MSLKRLLCGLRGHRTSVTFEDRPHLEFDCFNKEWEITAEVSCWCGETHFYEGHPAS